MELYSYQNNLILFVPIHCASAPNVQKYTLRRIDNLKKI